MDLLKEKYGNTLEAWREGLDISRNRFINSEEFEQRCRAVGYDGSTQQLFKWLQAEAAEGPSARETGWLRCPACKLAVLFKLLLHPRLATACEGKREEEWRHTFDSIAMLQAVLGKGLRASFGFTVQQDCE